MPTQQWASCRTPPQPQPMFEIILLAISSVLWYLCLVDPNAKLTESDRVSHERVFALLLPLASPSKYFMALYGIAEICAGSNLLPFIDLESISGGSSADVRGVVLSHISPVRFIALTVFILGGSLRLWAMHTLGTFFTFNLSIRSSHTLIRTGPYRWVRNPSYTGLSLMGFAVHILHNSGHLPRYFILLGARIGIQVSNPRLLLTLAWAANFVFLHYLLRERIIGEERMLEGEFKEEWKRYKKDTPYRLLPWIW
ncbi:hypothetical protein BS47DRAFT_1325186 [Hydnum rufescens UP504]|uniref:Protein-S-isoprenylcysteine O-methyltransferase n=1 Tax=Hydnum rufescens UP504 TaxID=1448309 RepID=A0A9P6E149_9AGAM|nr:hypothetical protein BS47DRAFT_1325186 [Hydnum rufescens UP504]